MENASSHRRLSEISHLFLSDVRAKTTGNAPRPVRHPPGSFKPDVSIDLTPEEFAESMSADPRDTAGNPQKTISPNQNPKTCAFKPVRLVIAHHLGELMADRVRDFAGMFTTDGKRVGLIYADAAQVQVSCVEYHPHAPEPSPDIPQDVLDPQKLREVLVELDRDVDGWMIVLPDPRHEDSIRLIRQIRDWTLISGVDHDTVVASYRTIKGMVEHANPSLSIAIYGAVDSQELEKAFKKLAGVCNQFLHLQSSLWGAIEPADHLVEHLVWSATAAYSKSQLASASQWKVLSDLIENASHPPADRPASPPQTDDHSGVSMKITPPPGIPASQSPASEPTSQTVHEIIDLSTCDGSITAILSAIIRQKNQLIESPIKPPHLSEAMLTVSRDHCLTLVAWAYPGLTNLRKIAQAYHWMNENRQLIAMALPQFMIDNQNTPRLNLLVDHADAFGAVLQPLMERSTVRIQAYRKLQWSGRTGLLLEAA